MKVQSLELPKKCDKDKNNKCKNKFKNDNPCKKIYKKAVKRICPKECKCKYKCLCGWEPDNILPEKKKNKQITKHFQMCIRIDYLGEGKERIETMSVIVLINLNYKSNLLFLVC